MLPRASRLHTGAEISAVSRSGARARVDDLSVAMTVRLPGPGPGSVPSPARACVVVGRRAGGAVDRNRQRRRVRHALVPVLPSVPGMDLVVRVGPGVARLDAPTLQRSLASAVERAARRRGQSR